MARRLLQFIRPPRSEPPLLTELAPAFAAELETLISQHGKRKLAASVDALRVVERCPCGDDECSSFYVTPSFVVRWRWHGHGETLKLQTVRGTISIDLIDGQIVLVEVLDRPDVEEALVAANMPGRDDR